MGNCEGLLVASNEEGRYRIHQGSHHVSIQEKSTEQNKTTPVSHHIGHLRHTIYFYSHGLHCQTPPFRILQYYTYDHRHFLESIYFYSLQRIHQRRKHCQTLRHSRTPTLWTSHMHYF